METKTKRERDEGYTTAFKSTALFGGVQGVTILVSILKSKVIALLLGPEGLGIMSLFNSAVSLISSVTNLGLQESAVRDIAYAKGQGDERTVAATVKAINRWVLATGLLGALITVALSPWLSRWVFKSDAYIISFILLSSVVLLTGIYSGQYATLQGTRHLALMAKANIFGAVAGFLCSLPMFYFFGDRGIVWALILTALSTAAVSWLYVKKAHIPNVRQSLSESYRIGLKTVRLGIMMAMSTISVTLVQFAIKTFITRIGGIADVGLYQAGWALNATYLGLVFTAMGKDYYPRLSQNASDDSAVQRMMNQQTEIALLLVAPLIVAMIVFMPFFIELLYSGEFLGIVAMTKWLLIGSLIRAGAWGISFVFLAKGDGRLFLFNELGTKLITLPAYLWGYYFFGLAGIGYAYTFNLAVYFAWVGAAAYKKYKISCSPVFWRLFGIMLIFVLLYPLWDWLEGGSYIVGTMIVLATGAFSLYELDKRINIRELMRKLISRIKR